MKEIYKEGLTFKISSKRSDHTFELDSRELNQTLGGAVFEAIPTIQAQMKKPDINLQVEIREEAAYISYETIKEQVAFLLVRLARVCSCFLVGSTHQ